MISSSILMKSTQTLLSRVNEVLTTAGESPVPIYRDGEQAANTAEGAIVWDYTSDIDSQTGSEPLSEPELTTPILAVWLFAQAATRRAVLEEALLDIMTPKDDNNYRRPFGGLVQNDDETLTTPATKVWFHAIYHTGTTTLPGSKQGQTGPEVPGLQLSFTCHVEVMKEIPAP